MEALLERLGIAELAGRHIRALSGGQQQRVFLARALLRRPDLLLLDEPTSGVDVATRQEILALLRELNDDGITVVLTTHDLNAVAATLPLLVCVNRRVIAQGSPADVFTPEVNYHGTASFTYVVSDGHGGTAEGSVSVTVNSSNNRVYDRP